ncbi:MAG: Gfo/Idh/MocA family oxidoreductase [Lachnospiraceae bacterium]|nr:Gfo/Idh/MocA family oxidoreductase [Lachnospiraceae bacterium]
MIGVAILGAGDVANIHIEAYQQLGERCEIRVISDLFQDKAAEKAKKYHLNCDIVADYHDLLERDDIQLVSVCLPPAVHYEVSKAFLEKGIHVLCEKPMAPTLEECDAMLEIAGRTGAKLSIVAQNRFKPDIMKTKELLDSGLLGKIYFAQANSLWWRGDKYYDLWWRGTWEKEGGGCTFIHAIHHIDLFLWLMGDVAEVNAAVYNQNHDNSEEEDLSIGRIQFKNGAVGLMIASLLHHGEEQKIIIDAQKASLEIPHRISVSRQQLNGYPENDEAAQKQLEDVFAGYEEITYCDHCGQIEDMLSAIEHDTEPLISGKDGRKTIEFITAVYQSAFTGKAVQFPMTEKDPFYSQKGKVEGVTRFHEKKRSVENYSDIGIKVGGTL